MATTKNILSEQIQRIYSRFIDKDNIKSVIDEREIKLLVNQSINKVLKLQVAESFKAGMIDVPKCNIVEYTCAVTSQPANTRAFITLPVIPINLPMDMGIWTISASNAAMTPYIPIPSQDVIVFQGTNLSALEQQVGYYMQGKKVYFTKDITTVANGSISSVLVNLLVSDFSTQGDNDLLLISPEVENSIIEDVLGILGLGKVAQAELQTQQSQQQ
jgi:hypothetical protein